MMKKQRYTVLTSRTKKCAFLHIITVKTKHFSQRFAKALLEEMRFEAVQHVQEDSCHSLLVICGDATAEPFLHVGEEVAV